MILTAVAYSFIGEALRHRTALIRRAVIDDYHFDVPVCLAEYTLDRLA